MNLPANSQAAPAASERGVSLWQDARRRLWRNPAARWSARLLCVMALLAFFAPLLPLQSPILQDLKRRQFQPPSLKPASLGLLAYRRQVAELQQKAADQSAAQFRVAGDNAAGREELAALQKQLDQLTASDPSRTLWHNPGWIASGMIRLRLAIFGDWCIPSICGTDSLGRDVLSRIFWGSRVSLAVGIIASLVSLVIGVSFGAVSGYYGSWVDDVMMRFVDILYSIPFIFVVIFMLTILSDPSWKSWLERYHIDQIMIVYILIGCIYWLTMARVVRGQVISLKNEQFVEAARTIGASRPRIIFLHIVPNVMSVVIVYLTLTIPAVMLFEAFLSFLGLGVQPPDVSLGQLVNDGVQVISPIRTFWWIVAFPSLTLTITLFALNFLGDGVRDALDPRMKNR